jgi:membrane dipeptidase
MNTDENNTLSRNEFSVDVEKLKKANSLAQTFALFVNLEEVSKPYEYCMSMAEKFYELHEMNKRDMNLATNYTEIIQNEENQKISALLSIEEGGVLEGKIENLQNFYDKGVRMMTLTWNYPNEIGHPHNVGGNMKKGLTDFGKEVVGKMNELGMLIDVSHLSDAGFYDVLALSKKPFIATHSNSRTITNHSRNLTDDMIKKLARAGGITGLNFCPMFVSDKNFASVESLIKHIKHIINVGGEDVLAMGTDFDGISPETELKDISQMYKLLDAMKENGISENTIEKIFYKNALRVIKEVL